MRLPRLVGLGHAMDLILTGRGVRAQEALIMGLINRVAPTGHARDVAEALAHEIAKFPQTCMREDRLSAYQQFDLSLQDALANEFRHGLRSLEADFMAGAQKFASGAGRHGAFTDH